MLCLHAIVRADSPVAPYLENGEVSAVLKSARAAELGASKSDLVVKGIAVVAEQAVVARKLDFRPGSQLVLRAGRGPVYVIADVLVIENPLDPGAITWMAPGASASATDADFATPAKVRASVPWENAINGTDGEDGRDGSPGASAPDVVMIFGSLPSGTFPKILLRGADGQNGTNGGRGGAGGDGAAGLDAVQAVVSCLRNPTDGGPGGDGGKGGRGGHGGQGGNGGSVMLIRREQTPAEPVVDLSAGLGGLGGDGGVGGQGGRPGQAGAAAPPWCQQVAKAGAAGRPGAQGPAGAPGVEGKRGTLKLGVANDEMLASVGVELPSGVLCKTIGIHCAPTPARTAGPDGSTTWGVVVAAYDSLERAQNEAVLLGKRSLPPGTVFNRNGRFTTIVTASEIDVAQQYLTMAQALAPDAYIVSMSRWCRNPRQEETVVQCDYDVDN